MEEPKEEPKLEKYRFDDQMKFRDALDEAPDVSLIQQRDLKKQFPRLFLPGFVIEGLADVFFRGWFVIDEKPLAIENGVGFTVKIQALPDYPGADYVTFTGTAAISFKSSKNAIEFDIPNARQRAIAKAFITLGNAFGRSFNRTYTLEGKKKLIKRGFSLRGKKEEKK